MNGYVKNLKVFEITQGLVLYEPLFRPGKMVPHPHPEPLLLHVVVIGSFLTCCFNVCMCK